jgi:hypothetical protein
MAHPGVQAIAEIQSQEKEISGGHGSIVRNAKRRSIPCGRMDRLAALNLRIHCKDTNGDEVR